MERQIVLETALKVFKSFTCHADL